MSDPRQLLDSDIPCSFCQYNLRGLLPTGRCPECSHYIADSLAYHRSIPLFRRRAIARTLFFIGTSMILPAISAILFIVLEISTHPLIPSTVAILIISSLEYTLRLVMVFRLRTQIPTSLYNVKIFIRLVTAAVTETAITCVMLGTYVTAWPFDTVKFRLAILMFCAWFVARGFTQLYLGKAVDELLCTIEHYSHTGRNSGVFALVLACYMAIAALVSIIMESSSPAPDGPLIPLLGCATVMFSVLYILLQLWMPLLAFWAASIIRPKYYYPHSPSHFEI